MLYALSLLLFSWLQLLVGLLLQLIFVSVLVATNLWLLLYLLALIIIVATIFSDYMPSSIVP